jgi:hypothetical protein
MPAVAVGIEALAALTLIAILLVAIALTAGVKVFVSALFLLPNATLGWVPWLGGKVQSSTLKIEHKINAELGAVVQRMKGAVNSTWHLQAWLIEQAGHAIWDATRVAARALYAYEVLLPARLAKLVAHAAGNVGHQARVALRPITNNYYTYKGITAKQFRDLLRKYGALAARVAALPALGAGALVLPFPRIGSLERRVKAWGSRLTRLEHRFGKKAFVASVATALGVLGLSWARKPCAKRTADAWCRVDPTVLGGLIGGLAVITGALSVVTFAEACVAAQEEVDPLIRRGVRELRSL